MLSPDYADFVRRDSAIPGLATLLDPEAFAVALQSYLPETKVGRVLLNQIRYTPGVKCLAIYQLEVGEKMLGVYAKAHGPDRGAKLREARKQKSMSEPLSQGRFILEDQGIVVSVFPNDSKLKALLHLNGAESRKKLLRELFQDRPSLWDATVQTLRYRPELRYVGRLEVTNGLQAVLKFYHPRAYSRARYNVMAFQSQRHLRIPPSLAASEHHGILALEWQKGHVLSDILARDPRVAIQAAQDTGAALAEFHSQEAQGLMNRTHEEEAATLLALADRLGFVCPRLAGRANYLAQSLAKQIASEPPVSRSIHGDFYPEQVILVDGQVAFLDLDEAVRGDSRIDLGLFIAKLEHDAFYGRLPSRLLSPLKEAFLESYRQTIGEELPVNLSLYIAAELFRLARLPFRYCEIDWITRTEEILGMVGATMVKSLSGKMSPVSHSVSSMAQPARVPVIDPFNARQDQKIPFLARALDPYEVEPYLARLIHFQAGKKVKVKLHEIRVAHYKAGRRCLVEYEVEVERHDKPHEIFRLLGKARTKGMDMATYNLNETFWNSGFNDKSSDEISVPQPIGIVPELEMWFQRKVQGTTATHLLVKSDGIELAKRIAEAIHKVHRSNIPSCKRHTMADELHILCNRLAEVAEQNPALISRIKRLLDASHSLASCVPEPETVGIHRDFYPDQVIVDGTRLYLTDFDLYCEGDPALDIGNFVGHLQEYALRKMGDIRALADQEEALVNRFLELSGESKRRSVEVYTTLTLIRHIWISTQFPDHRPFTEVLLSLCEQRFSEQLCQYNS